MLLVYSKLRPVLRHIYEACFFKEECFRHLTKQKIEPQLRGRRRSYGHHLGYGHHLAATPSHTDGTPRRRRGCTYVTSSQNGRGKYRPISKNVRKSLHKSITKCERARGLISGSTKHHSTPRCLHTHMYNEYRTADVSSCTCRCWCRAEFLA